MPSPSVTPTFRVHRTLLLQSLGLSSELLPLATNKLTPFSTATPSSLKSYTFSGVKLSSEIRKRKLVRSVYKARVHRFRVRVWIPLAEERMCFNAETLSRGLFRCPEAIVFLLWIPCYILVKLRSLTGGLRKNAASQSRLTFLNWIELRETSGLVKSGLHLTPKDPLA